MPTSPADRGDDRGLVLADVRAGYGANLVVRGVSATVPAGQIAAVVGPNGSGKSTLLKAVAGAIAVRAGEVTLDFRSLTVRENLEIGGYLLRRREVRAEVDRILARFPALARRRSTVAGDLSGGERRMLAVARTLLGRPSAVLLDEPSAGLSPAASAELLTGTVPALAAQGAAVLLVEQRVRQALAVAHHAYVLVAGTVAVAGPAAEVAARPDIGTLFLGAGPG
ncbi:MAG: ATP-binding cassette domain-containing protein [Actinobacteria bacterium]|nr:MAG: ATP-binding cassette domain-containing protein [Actinomycetota bacterium]